jgi:hypothetical protein
MTQIDDGKLDEEIEGSAQDGFLAGRGIVALKFEADPDPFGGFTNERILYECYSWRDYREGPAKRWRDVPWVAFREWIPEEDLDDLRDDAIKEKLGGEGAADKPILAQSADEDVPIWTVWDKATKRVLKIAENSEEVLSIIADPLGLSNFFPNAKPIQPIGMAGSRKPVCPYAIYENQAAELNKITRRITKLTETLKARGVAATGAEDLKRLADADDGEIVTASDLEGAAALGDMDRLIAWWPIEAIAGVLIQLYDARERIKAVIYEITGISDIIRGESSASETATAQQIKTQWGSIRIRKMQRLIERQVRELFVMSAELVAARFSPQTIVQISGVMLPPEGMQMLASPLDHYRIDVESDSTVRSDTARQRGEMAEFLNGTAQFMQAMMPAMSAAPQSAGPILDIYAAFARSFNLGKQAEDAIEALGAAARQAAEQAQQMQAQQAQEAQADKAFQQDMAAAAAQREDGKLQLQEAQAEFDAMAKLAEVELEDEQQRPVAIGDT